MQLERTRVLYLLDDPSKDKHVHRYVLNGLVEEGFSPTILYFYGDSRDSVMTNDHIDATDLGLGKRQFRGLNPGAVVRLGRYISDRGFSIVHAQRHRPLVHAALALSGRKGIGLFYTVRATNVFRGINRRLFFRLFGSRIAKIIGVSRGVIDYCKESLPFFPRERMTVIYNGVNLSKFDIDCSMQDARRFLGIPEEGFCFGIVARLKKAKCHVRILVAFKELLCSFPDTMFAIVGDGPLERNLRMLAKDLNIENKVFFTGKVDYEEVPIAMRAFDCFVHPSFREGLAVAVLEAMAARLPVIISNAPGLADIFCPEDGFCMEEEIGQMVTARNVPELVQAMKRYRALDGDGLRRIGLNARRHIERYFSREQMVSKTVGLYKDFLQKDNAE